MEELGVSFLGFKFSPPIHQSFNPGEVTEHIGASPSHLHIRDIRLPTPSIVIGVKVLLFDHTPGEVASELRVHLLLNRCDPKCTSTMQSSHPLYYCTTLLSDS